jgi:hypothetical protein
MAIDPSQVVWDDAPAIDLNAVQWDDAAPVEQPNTGLETGRMRGRLKPRKSDEAVNQGFGNLLAGGVRGAGSIGATILAPYDMAVDALNGKGLSLESNRQRRADMDSGLQQMGAEPESGLYQTGKLAGEIAGTAGAGGVLANGARAVGAAPSVVQGLASGGLNVAGATGLPGLLIRGATGAAVGGTAAGMVNPEDAGLGAMVGGAIPVGAKTLATGARAAGSALTGKVAPEVAALADRAKQLGIQIPADRITNSKPLNAVAASLEYVPFSGRAGTNERMISQLNRAVSRTFGQDSDNVTLALRNARGALGGEFDRVLQANTVRVDQQFADDLAQHLQRASNELGSDGEKIIRNQVDEILAKVQAGTIDGKAAYNIKRNLDRIAKRSTPEAFYAKEVRNSLMGALDRSLSPDDAAAFLTTRQQYGNMKNIEKLAANGAEGDISVARLANMKNVNNKDLQELADISAQFIKTRESPHGALQRLVIGGTGLGLGAGAGMLPVVAGTAAAGRATNSLLNSDMARRLVTGGLLNQPTPMMIRQGLLGASKVAPVLTAQ